MLIIVRNEEILSPKANFISQLLSLNFNSEILYVFKRESAKFSEKWHYHQVQLSSSSTGIILYYSLLMLKSPKDIRDRLMVRLSLMKPNHVLTEEGFLSILSRTLYLRWGTSARTSRLMELLNKLDTPKIFIIDEFLSLNCLNLKNLRQLGPIVYASQDIAHNRFGFGDHIITKKLMFKLERDAIAYANLVIACSETERLKYLQMGAKNAIYYPNIYPTAEFEPVSKDGMPSISIVLRKHWGSIAKKSLEEILSSIALVDRQIKVYAIGIKPKRVPRNINLKYWDFIPDKLTYLRLLSKSWIGINVGIHKAGTNERKYDYAEAGVVVLSDKLGARGDLLPYEYTYIDSYDLAAKIEQLLKFGKSRLAEMGEENRKSALLAANEGRQRLLDAFSKMLADS